MIRRPPRSTPLSLHDALPISCVSHPSSPPGPACICSRRDRHLCPCRRDSGHTHPDRGRSEEHTSELQSRLHLVCRLLLEKKKKTTLTGADTTLPAAPSPRCPH